MEELFGGDKTHLKKKHKKNIFCTSVTVHRSGFYIPNSIWIPPNFGSNIEYMKQGFDEQSHWSKNDFFSFS